MQCRICFEDGGDGVTPCQCRGTSAFIHTSCLDKYIRYYPDRICRVCKTAFTGPHNSKYEFDIAWGILGVSFCFLFASDARFVAKVMLMGSIALLTFYYVKRNFWGPTPLVFLGILTILFIPRANPVVACIWLAILGSAAVVYTLSFFVPVLFVLGIVVTLFMSMYIGMLTYAAYGVLDNFAFTVYVCVLYLVWYGWVQERPRLRFM